MNPNAPALDAAVRRYIELQGAETTNKGAHLMALTVLERFRRFSVPIEACVYPRAVPKHLAANPLRVLSVFPSELGSSTRAKLKARVRDRILNKLISSKDLKRYGLIRRTQLHGLVDISGYAYGDAWPNSGRKVELLETYRARNLPVVLLPQMLGPFETPAAKDHLRRLMDASSLVFARDPVSKEQVEAVVGKSDRLELAPDITIGFGCPEPLPAYSQRQGAIIIPNEKVLTKKGSEWGDSYRARLVAAIHALRTRGEAVTLLVHEAGGGDTRLAQELAKECDSEVAVRSSDDPLELKSILGHARLAIGSRYHSLVSALSSGTPSIALGWAHKYETLQADFGVPELQHRGSDTPSHLTDLIERVCDEPAWESFHRTLLQNRILLRERLDAMWPKVAKALGV